jgi:hypothetical protein
MGWGTLQVGRINLRETYALSNQVNATTGDQSVGLEGMESAPPFTSAQIVARSEDMAAMLDRALPVIFSSKTTQTGFYLVKDVGTVVTLWPEAEFFNWNLSLIRIGAENAVDMESRLGSTVRTNAFALTGERWHAPAVGAYGYFTGVGTPPSATVSRVLADSEGTLTVFRGLTAGVNPVWGITAPNYLLGRSRVLVDGLERSGIGIRIATTTWVLTNGLIRVTPLASAAMLKIEGWDGGAWSTHDFDITVGTDLAPPFNAMTILRNDFECVVIRLVKTRSPSGRVLVDLTLRRGAAFVEVFIQVDTSATLGVKTDSSVTTTNNDSSGYIVETANDASGNKLTMGVPIAFTGSTTGGVSKTSSVQLSAYVGYVIDGSSAVSGNTAINLRDQYIGSLAEQVVAVKR